jgi:hypothetical protein
VDHQLLVHQLKDRLNDMDQKMRLHHLDEIDNFRDRPHLQDVVYLVALQNQDEQNQDVVLTFQGVHLVHLPDVVVDVELRHQLRTDYFRDVVGVELLVLFHLQLKMDCCRDVEQQVSYPQQVRLHLVKVLVLVPLVQRFQRAMPLTLLNQRRVRQRVQRQVQG